MDSTEARMERRIENDRSEESNRDRNSSSPSDSGSADTAVASYNKAPAPFTTDSAPSDETPAATEQKKLTRRQLATVIILCFVNLLKYMDRYTVAGILVQIQCDFGIGDAEGGLLSTVFVVAYCLCAPLFGYLGDRHSRKLLMASGVFVWSLGTLVGSFMPNYWSFLVMRIIVGIGEASFSTVSPTVISDLCVGDQRSNFLILYYFAIPVGSGLGFIVGSLLANAFGSWHWGLRLTPILGAIAVFLMIVVVEEPARGVAEGNKHVEPTSWWSDLKYLAKNKSYVTNTIGVTLVTYVSGAVAWWAPKYFSLGIAIYQGEGYNVDNVATVFGATATVAGILGVWSGSWLGQKLRGRYPTADALVCAWGMIVSAPLSYWGLMVAVGPQWATYLIITLAQWSLNLNWATSGDILLYVVVPSRRASAEALMIMLSHALGDAGSPYIVGLVSDAFKPTIPTSYHSGRPTNAYSHPILLSDRDSSDCSGSSIIDLTTAEVEYKALQYSLLITIVLSVMSAFFFFANAWYLVEDKEKVDRMVSEAPNCERSDVEELANGTKTGL